MVLRIGFERRSGQFFIMINQVSTGRLSTVFTPTVTGISNFINIVKAYEKISILFDTSLDVPQRESIKQDIAANVTLP